MGDLKLSCMGDLIISWMGDLKFSCMGDLNISCMGDLNLSCMGDLRLSCMVGMQVPGISTFWRYGRQPAKSVRTARTREPGWSAGSLAAVAPITCIVLGISASWMKVCSRCRAYPLDCARDKCVLDEGVFPKD